MRNTNLALVVSATLFFCSAESRAESITSNIALQTVRLGSSYGLQVPVVLAHSQTKTLGPIFWVRHKVVGDLTSSSLKEYTASFPQEFWATDEYLRYLYRTSYITADKLNDLRIGLVSGMEIAIATTAPLPTSEFSTPLKEEVTPQRKKKVITPELDRAKQLLEAALQGDDPEQLVKREMAQEAESMIQKKTKAKLLGIFDNAQVSVTGIEGENPELEVGVVSILTENNGSSVFQQSSVNRYDDRTTLNLGVGSRFLSPDKRWLLGVNTFFDHEFPNDHQRASVGAEIKSSVIELSTNRYFGLSDYKLDSSGAEAKPIDGYDAKLKLALPYMPGLHLGYEASTWEGEDGAESLDISEYSLNGKLSQNLMMQLAHKDYSDGRDDRNSLSFSYSWSPAQNTSPSIFETTSKAWDFESMETRIVDFVDRENRIVKLAKQQNFQLRIVTE